MFYIPKHVFRRQMFCNRKFTRCIKPGFHLGLSFWVLGLRCLFGIIVSISNFKFISLPFSRTNKASDFAYDKRFSLAVLLTTPIDSGSDTSEKEALQSLHTLIVSFTSRDIHYFIPFISMH